MSRTISNSNSFSKTFVNQILQTRPKPGPFKIFPYGPAKWESVLMLYSYRIMGLWCNSEQINKRFYFSFRNCSEQNVLHIWKHYHEMYSSWSLWRGERSNATAPAPAVNPAVLFSSLYWSIFRRQLHELGLVLSAVREKWVTLFSKGNHSAKCCSMTDELLGTAR